MSELKVTYRGVDVPEQYHNNIGTAEWSHWTAGVNCAQAAQAEAVLTAEPELTTPPLRIITDPATSGLRRRLTGSR